MSLHIGLNGFGRIGRLIARALAEHPRDDVALTAINTREADPQRLAALLRHDSVHGAFPGEVRATADGLAWQGGSAITLARPEPAAIEWRELGVDIVLECSGRFNNRQACNGHIVAGAPRVLISAPCADADFTAVYGVNHDKVPPNAQIISNGSCTTNCLAPLAMILHEEAGIERGFMTTTHAYTTDQRLLDNSHADPRRARSAALSIVPTGTGAARAIGQVLPALEGRLDGHALRVPVPNVSMLELTAQTTRATSIPALHEAFAQAAQGPLAGVLTLTDEELVSVDYNHNPYSCVVDAPLTRVMDEHLVRLSAWYDNEWAFALRMLDMAASLAR